LSEVSALTRPLSGIDLEYCKYLPQPNLFCERGLLRALPVRDHSELKRL